MGRVGGAGRGAHRRRLHLGGWLRPGVDPPQEFRPGGLRPEQRECHGALPGPFSASRRAALFAEVPADVCAVDSPRLHRDGLPGPRVVGDPESAGERGGSRDIFRDPSALPVFNSHAIESQLHHIEGLSDRYLYLNDDVFFGRPTTAEQFFGPGGVTKFFPSTSTLDLEEPSAQDLPIVSAGKNNRGLMHRLYGRRITRRMKHTPHPQNREILQRFEDEHPEVFASVVASTFRHPSDVSLPAALYPYLALMQGKAHEGRVSYDFFDLGDEQVEARLAKLLLKRDLDVFCINETESSQQSIESVDAALGSVLKHLFPVPSPMERHLPDGTAGAGEEQNGAGQR